MFAAGGTVARVHIHVRETCPFCLLFSPEPHLTVAISYGCTCMSAVPHVHSTYRYGTLAALTRATMLLCALAQVFILMTAATRPNGAPLELMLAQSFAKNVSEGVGRQGS